jgi:hypothetical protein
VVKIASIQPFPHRSLDVPLTIKTKGDKEMSDFELKIDAIHKGKPIPQELKDKVAALARELEAMESRELGEAAPLAEALPEGEALWYVAYRTDAV